MKGIIHPNRGWLWHPKNVKKPCRLMDIDYICLKPLGFLEHRTGAWEGSREDEIPKEILKVVAESVGATSGVLQCNCQLCLSSYYPNYIDISGNLWVRSVWRPGRQRRVEKIFVTCGMPNGVRLDEQLEQQIVEIGNSIADALGVGFRAIIELDENGTPINEEDEAWLKWVKTN